MALQITHFEINQSTARCNLELTNLNPHYNKSTMNTTTTHTATQVTAAGGDKERNSRREALFQFLCNRTATLASFPVNKAPVMAKHIHSPKAAINREEQGARRESLLQLLGVPTTNSEPFVPNKQPKYDSTRQVTPNDLLKQQKTLSESQATAKTSSVSHARAPVSCFVDENTNEKRNERREALVKFLCIPNTNEIPTQVYPLLWNFLLDANGIDLPTISSLMLVCKTSKEAFENHPAASRLSNNKKKTYPFKKRFIGMTKQALLLIILVSLAVVVYEVMLPSDEPNSVAKYVPTVAASNE